MVEQGWAGGLHKTVYTAGTAGREEVSLASHVGLWLPPHPSGTFGPPSPRFQPPH